MSYVMYDFECAVCGVIEEHFFRPSYDSHDSEQCVTGTGTNNYPVHCEQIMFKIMGAPKYVHSEPWRAVNYRYMTRKCNKKPQYFLP